MNRAILFIISEGFPIVCCFIPIAFYQLYLGRKNRLGEKNTRFKQILWADIFVLYIALVLKVTGPGTIWDIGKYGSLIRPSEISLIPFTSASRETNILNIIMMLPLGFLVPLLWRNYRAMWKTALVGLGFSASIEICQLFNRRATDVDDLIMNTAGAMLGYLIFRAWRAIFKEKRQAEHSGPVMYILLPLLGRFLLCNWRLLVGLLYR